MTSRKTPAAAAASPAALAGSLFSPLQAMAEWNRQQVAIAMGASYALFKGFEAVRQFWIDMAGTTLEMQTQLMAGATHLVDSDAALQAASALEPLDAVPGFASLFGLRKPR